MPVYDYLCEACGPFSEMRPMVECEKPSECPHCGKQTELRLAVAPVESSVPRKVIVYTVVGILILILGLVAALIALNRAQNLPSHRNHSTTETAPAVSRTNAP